MVVEKQNSACQMVERMVSTVLVLWRYLNYLRCSTQFSLEVYHLTDLVPSDGVIPGDVEVDISFLSTKTTADRPQLKWINAQCFTTMCDVESVFPIFPRVPCKAHSGWHKAITAGFQCTQVIEYKCVEFWYVGPKPAYFIFSSHLVTWKSNKLLERMELGYSLEQFQF